MAELRHSAAASTKRLHDCANRICGDGMADGDAGDKSFFI
jgi:hypothetical protein